MWNLGTPVSALMIANTILTSIVMTVDQVIIEILVIVVEHNIYFIRNSNFPIDYLNGN